MLPNVSHTLAIINGQTWHRVQSKPYCCLLFSHTPQTEVDGREKALLDSSDIPQPSRKFLFAPLRILHRLHLSHGDRWEINKIDLAAKYITLERIYCAIRGERLMTPFSKAWSAQPQMFRMQSSSPAAWRNWFSSIRDLKHKFRVLRPVGVSSGDGEVRTV